MQRLKAMQSQDLVTGLSAFKVAEMHKVCKACQFGKHSKASFPHDKHVSKFVLEIVHSDVWGPAKTTYMGGCRFYVTFGCNPLECFHILLVCPWNFSLEMFGYTH